MKSRRSIILFTTLITILTALQYQIITDSILQKQTKNKPVSFFLLTLNKKLLDQLIEEIDDIQKNKRYQHTKINVGILGSNKNLQKMLNIKRYPFFGCKLSIQSDKNNEKDAQHIYYGMPDIVTANTIQKFMSKMIRYISYFTYNHDEIQQQRTHYPYTIQIPMQYIHKNINMLFNKAYYLIDFHAVNNEYITIYHNTQQKALIKQKISESHNYDQIIRNLALSGINQFGPEIYQQITHNVRTFMIVLDSIKYRTLSNQFKATLQNMITNCNNEKIRDKYSLLNKFHIFWLQGELNTDKKEYLGFRKQAQIPLLAQFIVNNPTIKNVFPDNNKLDAQNALSFILQTVYEHQITEIQKQYENSIKKQYRNIQIYKYDIKNKKLINLEHNQAHINNHTIVYSIPVSYNLKKCIFDQFQTETQQILHQLKVLKKLIDRVNRFTSIQYYLQTGITRKYNLILLLGYSQVQNLFMINSSAQISENTLKYINSQKIQQYFTTNQDLPQNWWIDENEFPQYLYS